MTTHWTRYLRHWQLLGPPLRPHADVIERVRSLVGSGARCLLLGATVEYATLGPRIVAMDAGFPMLAALWRSDDPARLGVQSDWTRMPVRARTFSHVLGDGSLNAVSSAVLPAVLDEVRRVLTPEGALIARVFCRPDLAESIDDIQRDLSHGLVGSFHALKWRVAMSALRDLECSDIAVEQIRRAIIAHYPDRDELCRTTGWSRDEVDTIDVYDGSTAVYNFPTEAMIVALVRRWFEDVELVRCGTYPLAGCCPLIVARHPIAGTP